MLAPVEFERYGHAKVLQTSAIQPQNGKAPSTLAQHDAIYEAWMWMWMWISERAPDLRRDRAKRQNCIDASVISTISSLFKQEHFDAMVSFAPKTVNSLDVCGMTMACVKVMFQSPGKVYSLNSIGLMTCAQNWQEGCCVTYQAPDLMCLDISAEVSWSRRC